MPFRFPAPLYPIADAGAGPARPPEQLAAAIVAAGIPFFQLRVKAQPSGTVVEIARAVKAIGDRGGAQLIINDRADVAKLIDAAGVHLGQEDLPPEAARALLGADKLIGLSTHTLAQVEAAVRAGVADYLAFGPIFPTRSKAQPDPVQGLTGLRRARQICPLPLVAIGGISADSLEAVFEAGADAAAVIGAVAQADDPGAAARELLRRAVAARALRSRRRS